MEFDKSSFEILTKKSWILDWNCVKFKTGYFIVFPPTDGSVKFEPLAVSYPGVIDSFNYLKEYLNQRLEPVQCSVEMLKLDIYDTIRLSEAIEKFATASKQNAIATVRALSRKRVKQISFQKALSIAQQLTPEEFVKYKSKYIDFLVTLQSKEYKVIPCVENLAHVSGNITEYAFMFSIESDAERILIVHENVNPDRATLLFVVIKELYHKTIRAIYDFLQSAEINKRSGIREGSIYVHTEGLISFQSVDHDDVQSWKRYIRHYIVNIANVQRTEMGIINANYSTLSQLLKHTQTKEAFNQSRSAFVILNLPLNRKVRPSDILNLFPESYHFIDLTGQKRLGIPYRRKMYGINSKGERVELKDKNGKPVYENKHKPIRVWSLKMLIELYENISKNQ